MITNFHFSFRFFKIFHRFLAHNFLYFSFYNRIYFYFSHFILHFIPYVHFYISSNIVFLRTVFSYDYFLFSKVYISLFVVFTRIGISITKAEKEVDSD